MRIEGHGTLMWERREIYLVLVENVRERDKLEDPVVDGMVRLGCDFRKLDVEV